MKKLLTLLALPAIIAPSAEAEDILSLIERTAKVERPVPPSIVPYNYIVDVVMSGREGKDIKEPFMAKLLIDPSASADGRVTILSASSDEHGEEFTEFLNELQDPDTSPEDMADEFWCESGNSNLFDDEDISLDDFTVVSETEAEAIIKPNLSRMAGIMMDADDAEDMSKSERKMIKRMMKRLDGEFVVSKPDVRLQSMKIWMTRPMTVAVIAKLKQMEVTQSCAVAPNGFTYRDSMTMRVEAKALGIGVEQNMDIKISGLTLR